VEGADRYDVYQGTSATVITSKVGSVTETSFSTTTALNYNTIYYYKVIPVTANGVSGLSSIVINAKTAIKNPVDLSVSSPNASTADLSWSAVEGAAGYEISFSKGTSTTYTVLRSVTTLTTNHTALTANTVFNYKVRAYRMAGTTKVYSGYSDVKSITTPPVSPVLKVVSKDISTLTLNWSAVPGATSYDLYQDDVLIQTLNSSVLTVDVSSLELGVSYKFKLVALNGELRSAPSIEVTGIPIPGSVNNFKVSDINFNRISLSWDSVEGADRYDVYQGTSATVITSKVGSVTETSFSTTTALNYNTIYYYKVIPVTANGVSGLSSIVINAKTAIKNPVDLSVSSPNASTADLSWSAVEGAAGYEISFSKGTSSTYTVLRSVTTLTTNHTALTANTVFNYKVRAYRMAGTTKVYSGYSDVKSITTPPTAPVIKAVSKSIDTITVTWTKVVNATGYVLYVNESEYTTIEDGNIISYDVSGLNLGESYSFRLMAKNGALNSPLSSSVNAIPIPGSVNNFKVSDINFNRISLSWDSVEGADRYDVYQGTSATVITSKVGSVTETSFSTTTALNYNTIYYYKVIPVTANGVSGLSSVVINAKTAIKNPVDLSVSSPNASTAELSWSAVEGAAGYEISFSKGTSSTYTVLRSVTTLTTNHTALTANTVFNYKVRAYRMAGTTKVYSGYSDVKSITTPPTAPVIKAVSKSIDTITVTWTKVVNATGYVLYVNESEYTTIEDGNIISYDVSGLNLGESYSFRLMAKNGALNSPLSSSVNAIPIPGSVNNFKVSDINFNRISLSWDSVEGADRYDVYQGTSATVITSKVGSVTETSFSTTTALNYNTIYYYKVIPVTANGVSGLSSIVINAKTAIKNPVDLSVSSPNASTAELSWSAVEGAAGYEISFSKGTSTTYTVLRSVTTLTTNHTALTANTVFNYKVRAYRMAGTTKVYSGYSDVKSITTPPVSPVLKVVSKDISTLTLNWSAVPGATSYDLYQDDVLIQTLNSSVLTVDVSSLELGVSYKFKLVALNGELRSAPSIEVTGIPIPGSVNNFKVSDINFNRVSLSWDSVEGADRYDVYQGTSATVITSKVGSVTETSFSTTTALNYNTIYYYKVIPVTANGVSGLSSIVINAKTAIKNPVDLSVSSPNASTADLSWSAVEGAAGYEISFSKGTSSTYTVLRSVTTLTTNHTALTANTVFNYKVRAYRMAGTTKVYSGYSDVKSITTPPVSPVLKVVSKDISTLTLNWSAVPGATSYDLYQDDVLIQTLNSSVLTVDVSSLELGVSYKFKLVALNGELRSAPSIEVTGIPIPGSVNNFKVSDINFNRISLSWDSVEGADRYDVYQGTSATVITSKVGSVTETSFSTTTALNYNTIYYYKVIPVTANGVSGLSSIVINAKTAIKNPVDLSVSSPNASTAELSWSAVEGAAGYEISFSKGTSTTYTVLRSVTTLTTNHTALTANTVFNYKVRAYRMAGTTKVYSGYSDVESIFTKLSTPVLKYVNLGSNSYKITWSAVPGATRYDLYRINDSTSTLFFEVYGNEVIFMNNPDEIYDEYYLIAYSSNNISSASSSIVVGNYPSHIKDLRVDNTTFNSIELSWSPLNSATSYDVYQGTSSTTLSKVANVSGTSYKTPTSLSFNQTYFYTVVPVVKSFTRGLTADAPRVSSKTSLQGTPSIYASTFSGIKNHIDISSVEGANGYEIFSSSSEYGTYSKVAETKELSYIHNNLTTNRTYFYKVRAYRMAGTVRIYTGYSNVSYATPQGEIPSLSSIMTDKVYTSTTAFVIALLNKGTKPLTVLSSGAYLYDYDYASFDRALTLRSSTSPYPAVSSVVVTPGVYTQLLFNSSTPTWYDSKTTIKFVFMYDDIKYVAFISSYFGIDLYYY
jgi:fibronectin type 3 domain-containing protein